MTACLVGANLDVLGLCILMMTAMDLAAIAKLGPKNGAQTGKIWEGYLSDAQEPDLFEYLAIRRTEFEQMLRDGRNRVLAQASARGTLQSGGTHKLCVGSMEQMFDEYVTDLSGLIDRWAGEQLPEKRIREIITGHLRQAVEELATAETACGALNRGIREGTLDAINGIVSQTKTRVLARVRQFELGADRPLSVAPSALVQIVHAHNIIGGVMQAGGEATQVNTVQLSAETIGASLDHLLILLAETAPELRAEIEHDAATIQSQLKKTDPNPTIVQEAGRSIRTVLEGAAGGVLATAMTPGLAQAITAFGAAIGAG